MKAFKTSDSHFFQSSITLLLEPSTGILLGCGAAWPHKPLRMIMEMSSTHPAELSSTTGSCSSPDLRGETMWKLCFLNLSLRGTFIFFARKKWKILISTVVQGKIFQNKHNKIWRSTSELASWISVSYQSLGSVFIHLSAASIVNEMVLGLVWKSVGNPYCTLFAREFLRMLSGGGTSL